MKRYWGDCRQVRHRWKLMIVTWLQKSLPQLQTTHAHNRFQGFSNGHSAVLLFRKAKQISGRKVGSATRDTWTQYHHEKNREELWNFMGLVGSKTVWLRYGSKKPCLKGGKVERRIDKSIRGKENQRVSHYPSLLSGMQLCTLGEVPECSWNSSSG